MQLNGFSTSDLVQNMVSWIPKFKYFNRFSNNMLFLPGKCNVQLQEIQQMFWFSTLNPQTQLQWLNALKTIRHCHNLLAAYTCLWLYKVSGVGGWGGGGGANWQIKTKMAPVCAFFSWNVKNARHHPHNFRKKLLWACFFHESLHSIYSFDEVHGDSYRQVSNIRRTLVGNKIVDRTLVGNNIFERLSALLQLHFHSRLNIWLHFIGQRQTRNI